MLTLGFQGRLAAFYSISPESRTRADTEKYRRKGKTPKTFVINGLSGSKANDVLDLCHRGFRGRPIDLREGLPGTSELYLCQRWRDNHLADHGFHERVKGRLCAGAVRPSIRSLVKVPRINGNLPRYLRFSRGQRPTRGSAF